MKMALDSTEVGEASALIDSGAKTCTPPDPTPIAEASKTGIPYMWVSGAIPENLKSFQVVYGFIVESTPKSA